MLHDQKHLLYDDEQILDNIERAEELSELLSEYNVKNVAELRAVIEKHAASSQLLPVTQQIIASLGITSVEEWTKALEDKNLAALFSHESTPTPEMFVLAQSLIRKAKERVIAHLSTLDEYDLTDMDETALTVLAGVKKDGRDVNHRREARLRRHSDHLLPIGTRRPGLRRPRALGRYGQRRPADHVRPHPEDNRDSTVPDITLWTSLKTSSTASASPNPSSWNTRRCCRPPRPSRN